MKPDFKKQNGLIPVIIQDNKTDKVLMLGYMNEEAWIKTNKDGLVTFYSRSKKRLWTKGETSGNFLRVIEIKLDCDKDTLLIKVNPDGPVCHTGADTCFDEENESDFLRKLSDLISDRKKNLPENSYTTFLFTKGTAKIAQKVGEEAVEVVIEALKNDQERLINESADLLFHLLVLLEQQNTSIEEVISCLKERHTE